jgi:hypothetical protein
MPTDFAPHTMTSNVLPTPLAASASNVYAGFAYSAFNGNLADYWAGPSAVEWLQIDLGSASHALTSYAVAHTTGGILGTYAPRDFTLRGSNDASTWVTLDTRTGETGWANTGETRTYTCTSPTGLPYRYYRLNITAGNGSGRVAVGELYLYETSLTAQTITFATIPAHLTTDGPITLAATASSGLTVTYGITGPATLAGSVVTLTGSVGTVVVTASQAGNGTYAAAPNVVRSFAVTAAVITSRGGITYDQITASDRSGTGTKLATVTGAVTTGHVPAFDASGALIDGGTFDVSGAAAAAQAAAILASLQRASNLSDLGSVATAKTNLGLVAVASSGSAADLTTGTLPAARLPNPSTTTLGGIQSYAAVANQFLDRISTSGVPLSRAIVAGDIPTLNQSTTGSAASFTGSLAGDVTGTQAATVVGKLNGVSLAGLATGILKITTTTGVPSIALSADIIAALGYTPTSPTTLAAWPGSANITTLGTITSGTVPAARVSGLAAVATSGSAADLTTGTLLAARMPALTGDVTSTAGTVATTVGKINGVTVNQAGNNIVIGIGSLLSTTGTQNFAFGPQSVSSNTSGNQNLGIGSITLYLNTTGSGNIGIGFAAGSRSADPLQSNITGNNNTFIGTQASIASGSDPLTNATAIGSFCSVPTSNTVALGDGSVTRIYLGMKVSIYIGAGSPNSAVVGKPGDIYLNTSGGAGTTIYIKESGTNTNTGWIGK